MVTNSGITTFGNRTFFFGGASGIDTSALIKSAFEQRKREADKIDVQIQKNTSQFDAYENMRTLANDIKSSLANIKKNYSFISQNQGLFDQRAGTLSSSTAVSAQSLVDVALDPGTDLGSYDFQVLKKAQAQKVRSASQSSATTALGLTGNFSINVDGKPPSAISVTSGMTLNDVAAAINAGSATSGVRATVARVTATDFQLVLTGSDLNKAIQVSGVSGTNVLQSLGATDGAGVFLNELQAAQAAEVRLDGITYSRDTNEIDDLIEGVTLKIKNADPATTIGLNVENNNEGIKDGILKFIESYNSLRDFIKQQQVVSTDGEVSDSAVLFGDTLLASVNRSVQGILGRSFGAGGTNLATLREIGITLDKENRLEIDESVFDNALINKFDEVRGIFETQATTDNSQFRISGNRSEGSKSFALDITMSGSTITGASIGGDNSLFTISGQSIIGNAGTQYEGMTFAYVGTTSTTVNINIQAGLADDFDSVLTKMADILTGEISKEMTRISDTNTLLETRASRIIERAEDFRQKLIDRYANFESRLASAQTVLAQLRALTGNNQDN